MGNISRRYWWWACWSLDVDDIVNNNIRWTSMENDHTCGVGWCWEMTYSSSLELRTPGMRAVYFEALWTTLNPLTSDINMNIHTIAIAVYILKSPVMNHCVLAISKESPRKHIIRRSIVKVVSSNDDHQQHVGLSLTHCWCEGGYCADELVLGCCRNRGLSACCRRSQSERPLSNLLDAW